MKTVDLSKYMGIPFKTRSFNKEEGLDCLTFILYFLEQEFGYKFDTNNVPEYGTYWYMNYKIRDIYIQNLRDYCTLREYDKKTRILPFELLLFSYFNEKEAITHVGIYVGDNKFIHCVQDAGVCVANLKSFERALKWVGRVNNVEYI